MVTSFGSPYSSFVKSISSNLMTLKQVCKLYDLKIEINQFLDFKIRQNGHIISDPQTDIFFLFPDSKLIFFVLKWCNSNQNCCILKYKIRPILLCIKNILLKKIFYCHGNNICRRTLLNIEVVLKGIIAQCENLRIFSVTQILREIILVNLEFQNYSFWLFSDAMKFWNCQN